MTNRQHSCFLSLVFGLDDDDDDAGVGEAEKARKRR